VRVRYGLNRTSIRTSLHPPRLSGIRHSLGGRRAFLGLLICRFRATFDALQSWITRVQWAAISISLRLQQSPDPDR
jgi:hypothetical protein